MPFLEEVFSSEIIKKPVLDLQGEELGRVKDLMVIKGDHLPIIAALIIELKKKTYCLGYSGRDHRFDHLVGDHHNHCDGGAQLSSVGMAD